MCQYNGSEFSKNFSKNSKIKFAYFANICYHGLTQSYIYRYCALNEVM